MPPKGAKVAKLEPKASPSSKGGAASSPSSSAADGAAQPGFQTTLSRYVNDINGVYLHKITCAQQEILRHPVFSGVREMKPPAIDDQKGSATMARSLASRPKHVAPQG